MPRFHIILDEARGETVEMRLPDATARAVKSVMKDRKIAKTIEIYRARKDEHANADFDGSDLQDKLMSRVPDLTITFKGGME